MKNLFISWAGSDGLKIGELIRSFFHQYKVEFEVFLSNRDIGVAQEWQKRLLDALSDADRGLAIFTQEAIKSEWLIHETAILSSRVELSIFLLGTPLEMLPEPLRRFQCKPLTRDSMADWTRRVMTEKNIIISYQKQDTFLDDVERVVHHYADTHVTAEEERWRGFSSRVMFITKQHESPFDLMELIRVTRERIVLVAQNHGYMTISDGYEKFEEVIFKKLASGVAVDILAMHPLARPKGQSLSLPDACSVWGGYMGVSDFSGAQMAQCWSVLRRWHHKAQTEFVGTKLRIRGAYLLPLTLNIVDPEKPHGFLTLSPRIADPANTSRPQVVLTKRYEPHAFGFYWESIRNGFDQSGWVKIEAFPSIDTSH